ncbi:MAG: ectoine synthase [Acidihalobacter sp.]|jgi:L-ectoine synthase|uniref:ectoine synthase n=1 Tax=Acidihalobacter sp. TaxID=1872108 RepID=UPI00307F9496
MIVRTLDEVKAGENSVRTDTFESNRMLIARDGVGFSLNHTVLYAGTVTHIWYQNHIEAVYCLSGEARIECLASGKTYTIKPGTLYTLDGHEEHNLHAVTDFECLCVFDPPLTGREVHDENGVYPLMQEDDAAATA